MQAGFGNSYTIANMLRIMEFDAEEVRDSQSLSRFSHIVLPGVGNWSRGSELLLLGGWVDELHSRFSDGAAILGVCLGMQLLGKRSEEGPGHGLGLIDFNVERITQNSQRKINVGWKQLSPAQCKPDFQAYGPFYFTHSYCVPASGAEFEIAYVSESKDICGLVNVGNVWGAQFHPERSNTFGMHFLRNFVLGSL